MDYRGRTSAALDEESSGRSLTGMLKDVGTGIRDIVRSEIKLAKVEARRHRRPRAVGFHPVG